MKVLKVVLSSIPRGNYMFSVKASWPIQEAKESLQEFERNLFFVLCWVAEVCASKALVLGWGMAAGCPGGVSSKEKGLWAAQGWGLWSNTCGEKRESDGGTLRPV